jgi:hypothetical protein
MLPVALALALALALARFRNQLAPCFLQPRASHSHGQVARGSPAALSLIGEGRVKSRLAGDKRRWANGFRNHINDFVYRKVDLSTPCLACLSAFFCCPFCLFTPPTLTPL